MDNSFVSRFTWQLPQTVAGFLTSHAHNTFGIKGGVESVNYKYGATVLRTNKGSWGAITLSSYIIGDNSIRAESDNYLFQHEYGHYLQSQATGPLYLQRYGIPSALSRGNHDYHPVEQDANARSFKYFNKHIPEYDGWNFWSNPIIGYNSSLPYDNENNQLALKYARLQSGWHDWVFGPNIIISGLINAGILNNQDRFYDKLRKMYDAGLYFPEPISYW
jgi:hypothetical protein